MAKKQPKPTSESKTAPGESPKRSPKPAATKPASGKGPSAKEKPAPPGSQTRKRVISEAEIGTVAGELWGVLYNGGGQSVAALKKSIDAPGDLVAAAVGWLAREGKLDFAMSGRTLKVSLK